MKHVLVAFLALLVGVGIGWMIWNREAGRVQSEESSPAIPHEDLPARAPIEAAPPEGTVAKSDGASRAEAGLISAELRRYALDEITAGWEELRKDPIPDSLRGLGFKEFETVVKKTPREIGRKLAGHQSNLDALAAGDAISILRALDKDTLGPQLEMVRDQDRFHAFFRCQGGETLDGPATLTSTELQLPSRATLRFGAGVHVVRDWMRHAKVLPDCVTIAGSGMDQTLLVLRTLSAGTAVDRLTIRDCTVYTDNGYLFDLRSEPAVLAFERVRICGFDSGAGGSCVFGTRGTAILATDCRFEGGYGRGPAFGTLFDVRTNALLARFEGCTFSRMYLHPQWMQPGATAVFVRCGFERLFDKEQDIRGAKSGVVFDLCSTTYADARDPALQALDLNELFPDWRAQIGR